MEYEDTEGDVPWMGTRRLLAGSVSQKLPDCNTRCAFRLKVVSVRGSWRAVGEVHIESASRTACCCPFSVVLAESQRSQRLGGRVSINSAVAVRLVQFKPNFVSPELAVLTGSTTLPACAGGRGR